MGPAETRSGVGAWRAAFAHVSTADAATARDVAAALEGAGAPASALNFDGLASDSVALWQGGAWGAGRWAT